MTQRPAETDHQNNPGRPWGEGCRASAPTVGKASDVRDLLGRQLGVSLVHDALGQQTHMWKVTVSL